MSNAERHGELMLFDCPRVRKSEYWQFIKLVAPPDAALPDGQTHWVSQDATHAFCLRCSKRLGFTKGSSNSVRRHMERFHRKDLMARRAELEDNRSVRGRVTTAVTRDASTPVAPTAPVTTHKGGRHLVRPSGVAHINPKAPPPVVVGAKRVRPRDAPMGAVAAVDQRYGAERLLQWMARSLRPLTMVNDRGFAAFVAAISGARPNARGDADLERDGDTAFTVPGIEELRHRLTLMKEQARFEVRQALKKQHVTRFALTTHVWQGTHADHGFVVLRCWHLTETFRRQSWVLGVVPMTTTLSSEAVGAALGALLDDGAEVRLLRPSLSLLLLPENDTLAEAVQHAGLVAITDVRATLDRVVSQCAHWPHPSQSESEWWREQRQSVAPAVIAMAPTLPPAPQPEEEATSVSNHSASAVDVQRAQLACRTALQDVCLVVRWIQGDPAALARFTQWHTARREELAALSSVAPTRWTFPVAFDFLSRVTLLRSVLDGFVSASRCSQEGGEVSKDGDSPAGTSVTTPTAPTAASWLLLEGLVLLWRPLHEFSLVLNNEQVCSVAFILPILSMVKQHFTRTDLFVELRNRHAKDASAKRHARGDGEQSPSSRERDGHGDADTEQSLDYLQLLRLHLLEGMNTRYDAFCRNYSWVSALDPRYGRMRHLNETDREECKSRLVEQAMELYVAQLPPPSGSPSAVASMHGIGAEMLAAAVTDFANELLYTGGHTVNATVDPHAGHHLPGIMHRLLYDDEDDATHSRAGNGTTGNGDEDLEARLSSEQLTRETEMAQTRVHVTNEVDMYCSEHQLRKTRIACPLQWWGNNRGRYPFLAPLARIWLGTLASLPSGSSQQLPVDLCSPPEVDRSPQADSMWRKTTADLLFLHSHLGEDLSRG